MSENTEWISRAEAARRLGVSVQTVDRYVAAEMIGRQKNKITGRVTLAVRDVETLRREREVSP